MCINEYITDRGGVTMDLRKLLLTKNDCYKASVKMTPKGIMWHSTGANNPNLKRYVGPDDGKLGVNSNNNHWNTAKPGGRQVCVHAFIGKDKDGNVCTYQTLPFDIKGWHSGGSANNSYIGFEICEDDLSDKDYFNKVYKEAVEFTAYLCKKYNLDPTGKNVIICHQDGYKLGIASDHGDVYHWFNKFGKTMEDVRKDVKKAMGVTTTVKTDTVKTNNTKSFKVRVKIKNLNVRKGPGKKYSVVCRCPVGSYTITETKTSDGYTWGKLKSGMGWIALKYAERL